MDILALSAHMDLENKPHVVVSSKISDLQPGTVLTLFHGCDFDTALKFLRNGIDGTKVVGRTHNQGQERGLYVTPSIKCARSFGYVVLEIRLQAKDLYPTARWGLGAPSSRKSDGGKAWAREMFPNSFRPIVSQQLSEKQEPQAMFLGFAPRKSIVAAYIFEISSKKFTKLAPDDAIAALAKRLNTSRTSTVNLEGNETAEQALRILAEAEGHTLEEVVDALKEYVNDPEIAQHTLAQMGAPRPVILRIMQWLRKQ